MSIAVSDDFWREVESKAEIEEDEGRNAADNATDEGEIEADWLNDVGFGELSQQWRQGKSLPESDIGNVVQKLSLKPHQADAVRKRIRTLNATLKKRRKNQKRRPPDVRSFFQSDQNVQNKDSSRSATPDSLDSIEYVDESSTSSNALYNVDEDRPIDNSDHAGIPSFVSVFDNQIPGDKSIPPLQHRQNKDIFKHGIKFPVKASQVGEGEIATDDINGIEMLNYHNIGTIYMKGYLHQQKHPPIPFVASNLNENQQTFQPKSEISSLTYTAAGPLSQVNKPGFTEELTKKHGDQVHEDDLLKENSYVDPSGQTRLSDFSEEDIKNLRPILLMELTAQCDHLNIQIRRRKGPKGLKKVSLGDDNNTHSIFGSTLDQLLARDRRLTGESNLQIPIAFEKMINHLWKRGLHDEGLLRMAGHKGKINELRSTFESSLYTEPEQVDAAMSQCSSHDVANLLKQFIRELPVPLLGFEYIDTFFDVTGELKDRPQENCLSLLLLLLPESHQAVLLLLLEFLRDLVKNSDTNKMSLNNVALILAPNLVPSSAINIRSQEKEISRAATWVCLTQILIRSGSSLFVVPSDLLSQMRQINDSIRKKKNKGGNPKSNMCPQTTSVTSCLRVSAPQLGFPEVLLPIHAGTTAGDIVLFLLEEAERKVEYLEREGNIGGVGSPGGGGNRRRCGVGRNELSKTNQGPSLSCLLAQVNKDLSLKSHSLYEVGGNIGYRRIDPSALIPCIIRDNPFGSWVLRCSHRHAATTASSQR